MGRPDDEKVAAVWEARLESHARLLALRNRHRDGRAFILGCGPSLSRIPPATLSRLGYDPVVFACNYLFRWGGLPFRPSYWCASEWDHVQAIDSGLLDREHGSSWLPVPRFIASADLEGHLIRHLPAPYFERWTLIERDMAKPITHGFLGGLHGRMPDTPEAFSGMWAATGGGVVFECAVQLAAWMGCRDIFLLGVDAEDTGYVYDESAGAAAKRVNQYAELRQVAKCAAESLAIAGISLYNATPGGKLDSIQRVRLRDVLTP